MKYIHMQQMPTLNFHMVAGFRSNAWGSVICLSHSWMQYSECTLLICSCSYHLPLNPFQSELQIDTWSKKVCAMF